MTERFVGSRFARTGAAKIAGGFAAGLVLLALTVPARGADPLVVLSVTAGGSTTICDTPPGMGCLTVGEEDLILCKPTSVGLPITKCHWIQLLNGNTPGLSIDQQIRALDIAPNGNLAMVELNDDTVPGLGTVRKQDIVVLNPSDILGPFVGGGPYSAGTFKLYLDGDLTLEDSVVAKPWDAVDILKNGSCEAAIDANGNAPHSCPIIGSLTGGSGGPGLGGVHFENEDLLRCLPNGFALNGAVESCIFAMFLEADQLNGGGAAGISSDIEAIDFLSFDPATMSGQMAFKMGSGNPTGFPAHDAGKDLLLYTGTFGNGNCSVTTTQKCAGDTDCPLGETCNTGTCAIGGAECASDGDCTMGLCNRTRTPVGTVTKFFDGVAVGLTGSPQTIEAFAILPETDGDGIPDGVDNCPNASNPPSVCSGPGPETCPSGLSSQCPMGETCVQLDSDGDGVGDACDQCNGRPDPGTCDGCPGGFCPAICGGSATAECTCGDGTLDIPAEQCDLGAQNGAMGSPCSATCTIFGSCTGSMAPCTVAADCPPGQGCCGNHIVEAPEACDDANAVDNDQCHNNCTFNPTGTPILGCDNLVGPNVIPASIKLTKFKDTKDALNFDRWKTKGTFSFAQGLTIDPDTQPVTIIYNNNPSGQLFSSKLDPTDCIPTPCFVQQTPKTKWKFKDKEADVAGAPSWHKGKLKIKNQGATFNMDGRKVTLFTTAQLGGPPGVTRQTIRIGDVCVTGVVQCTASGNGKSQKCLILP